MNSSNSFCRDSSCSNYRSHDTIFNDRSLESSRNFFSFKYISW